MRGMMVGGGIVVRWVCILNCYSYVLWLVNCGCLI